MKRISAAVLICIFLTSFADGRANSRPFVSVNGPIHLGEFLAIQVEAGDKPVTYCERLLITVKTDAGIEDAPRGFDVEYLDNGKWILDTSGIPDVNPMYNMVHLPSGGVKRYRLRIFEPGVYRFRLRYTASHESGCPLTKAASKSVLSDPMEIKR